MHHINTSRITHVMYNLQTLMAMNVFIMILSENPWQHFQKWVKKLIIKAFVLSAQHLSISKYENIETVMQEFTVKVFPIGSQIYTSRILYEWYRLVNNKLQVVSCPLLIYYQKIELISLLYVPCSSYHRGIQLHISRNQFYGQCWLVIFLG